MSPGLKPLLLPRLVERRKLDDAQTPFEAVDGSFVFLTDNTSSSDLNSPATPTFSHRSALGHLRCSSSSSSLDLAAPSPIVPDCSVLPICLGPIANSVSPAPTAHSNNAPKRLLPDVQEEDPLGRDDECSLYEDDDEDSLAFPEDAPNLYGCLCDEPCFHGREDEAGSQGIDYDFGFVSDGDNARTTMRSDSRRKRYGSRRNGSRNGSVSGSSFGMGSDTDRMGSPFTNLTLRVGSRIHALSRWRSGSAGSPRSGSNTYANLIGAPASEPALLPSLSRVPSRAPSQSPSSRSSLSVSRSVSRQPFSLGELTRSTSVSYYGSTDSLPPATNGATSSALDVLDVQEEEVRRSMERDRAKATTPLLPPLFLDRLPPSPAATSMHSPPPSLQTSPILASPTGGMFPDAIARVASTTTSPVLPDTVFFPGQPAMLSRINTTTATKSPMDVLPSPPLSTKQSVSSFRPPHVPHLSISVTSSNGSLISPTPMSPQSVTAAATLELHDEWSDRLGHANYTILPRPCRPTEVASMEVLLSVRADWSQARVNYTKHLMRVGEHYGTTSNTYLLTEEKWAETERAWRAVHESLVADCAGLGSGVAVLPLPDNVSSVVPRILDAEGKFPNLGDEDIVGPMERAAAVNCFPEERHGSRQFWRNLAGKVGLRK